MRVAMRSGSPAPSRITSSELSMLSGDLSHDCNYISRTDRARLHYAGVKATHAPSRRRRVKRLHAFVIDLQFQGGTVNIQGRARTARLRDLQQRSAGANAVPNA